MRGTSPGMTNFVKVPIYWLHFESDSEKRPLGRVSKDGPRAHPSFEARRRQRAPQDDGGKNYFASSFERRVAAATARVSSDCMPSGPISTSSAAAGVPPGQVP